MEDPISEFWRNPFTKRYAHVFNRLSRLKNRNVFINFKIPLILRQPKGRKAPIHNQDRVFIFRMFSGTNI